MPYTTLLLDLDGTVYPLSNGIWKEISARMELFMQKELNLPIQDIPRLRQAYYQQYGTTLSGLRQNFQVNEEEFLHFVHDIPLDNYLAPDPKLRNILKSLPQRKWIFTNSDKAHARRVLTALNILDLFDGILDITHFNYLNKPNLQVYQLALETIGNPDINTCIFVDDSSKNLIPAKQLGIKTVFIGEHPGDNTADYHIRTIYELPAILLPSKGV